jgi:hypothetical protein
VSLVADVKDAYDLLALLVQLAFVPSVVESGVTLKVIEFLRQLVGKFKT